MTSLIAAPAPRLLVVDDNADTAHLAKLILEREGFVVSIAVDGEEAVSQASTVVFDLVLLDLRLPTMSGFEVCRELKKGGPGASPVVLFFTVSDFHADRQLAIEAGGDGYLVKPFRADDLVDRVKTALHVTGK